MLVMEKNVLACRANWLGGQVVRRRSRKPKIRGSIPRRAWGFRMSLPQSAKGRAKKPTSIAIHEQGTWAEGMDFLKIATELLPQGFAHCYTKYIMQMICLLLIIKR